MLLVHRRGVRPEQGGALGLRPTCRLQPWVLAGVRKDGVGDWLVGSERLPVRCPRATLGHFGASPNFLVSGTRAEHPGPCAPRPSYRLLLPVHFLRTEGQGLRLRGSDPTPFRVRAGS